MSLYGSVQLKKRYLGDAFIGQELCYCKIEVGVNSVCVIRMKGGHAKVVRFVEGAAADEMIIKLRNYIIKMQSRSRWSWSRIRPGVAYMMIYYPSVTWMGHTCQLRLFSVDGAI